ncbi:UvrD-helicase domain-containing protein [candidate division TA06 bacterium]|uniref:DNA 3'-5' helicase n=1 Tax=candidate division TA06 bacterium TaxID=2250710 RepID=A0A933MKG3_UNCT6|nr:UvrD-helicase domain-containing protein [candidate division TA06 bacterium]
MSDVLKKDGRYRFPHLLLIEASAGSGKTQALSSRFVQFLLSSRIEHNQLPHLLAITFTNNAAREMKQRILIWLKELALGNDPGFLKQTAELLETEPEKIPALAFEMVDKIIEHFSDFQVQTIDSFTNRLAQASARELGFRPDFQVTTSYGELLDYSLTLLLKQTGRDQDLTGVMGRFLELLNASGGSFAWDPQPLMRESFEKFLSIEAKESGRFTFKDQTAERDRCLEIIKDVYQQICGIAQEQGFMMKADAFASYLEQGNVDKILARSTYNSGHTPMLKGKPPKNKLEAYEATKELWGKLGPVVAGLAAAHSESHYAAYGQPYHHFKQIMEQTKRRRGVVHIDDIARKLSQQLDQEMIPGIYLALGAKLCHYLIDEFQDTDLAQWRSLHPLLSEALASGGSAFLVGDLKQSIYLFRKADYKIMKQLQEEIQGKARPLIWLPASVADSSQVGGLEQNFRCGQAILEYVEQAFHHNLEQLIGEGILGPDRTGLLTYVQRPSEGTAGRGYVRTLHIPKGAAGSGAAESSGDPDADPGPDAVAGAVADDEAVLDAADASGLVDQEPERATLLEIVQDVLARGYSPQDIAVLAPKNKHLGQAIGWLTQAGIPASSSGGLDIRQRRVVAELIEILRFLDSPIDNLAWASVVKGRILASAAQVAGLEWSQALADDILLGAGQRAGTRGYHYQECRRDPRFAPVWGKFFSDLYRLAGYYPLYDLVCLALGRFGVFKNFPDEAAALLKLLETVNQAESQGQGSLKDFLEACQRPEPELFSLELPENVPAVQLMSFHKSKGLGFPVVINLLYDEAQDSRQVYYGKTGEEIALYKITAEIAGRTREYPHDLAALRDGFLADDQVQELNALYVVCTRARHELYNLVIYKPPKPKKAGVIKKQGPAKGPWYPRLFPLIDQGHKETLSRKAAPAIPGQPAIGRGLEPGTDWEPEQSWEGERYLKARLGQFYHKLLEGVAALPDDTEARLLALARRHRELIPGRDIKALAAQVKTFLERRDVAPFFVKAGGQTVLCEAQLVGPNGELLRVDRLVRDGNLATVIDFKTGRSDDPKQLEQHQAQVRGYLTALAGIFPGQTLEGQIVYLDGDVKEVRP